MKRMMKAIEALEAQMRKNEELTEDYIKHVIQRGETASMIAREHNVRLSEIIKCNPGSKPDCMRIGQKIK